MKRNQRKPRKVPTQSRARATWDAILDGAAEGLLKQGYEKATTDRIAERAGVSIGSVYEYFPNKEAIFAAVMLRWNEQRSRIMLGASPALSETRGEKLRNPWDTVLHLENREESNEREPRACTCLLR